MYLCVHLMNKNKAVSLMGLHSNTQTRKRPFAICRPILFYFSSSIYLFFFIVLFFFLFLKPYQDGEQRFHYFRCDIERFKHISNHSSFMSIGYMLMTEINII